MTMIKNEISIILLTYNREQFISQAIESALAQTYQNFELIIVDNGSTDKSFKICQEFSEKDSRIKLISKEKGNIGSGRNAGIKLSTGEYILFIDDDDYFESDMLEFLIENAEKYDSDISICGCYSDFGDHLEVYYVYDELYVLNTVQGVHELLRRKLYNSANPCKLFKRKLFDNVDYLETGRYDDIHTLYKLFANANRVVIHGIPKYYFRKHTTNNSGFLVTNAFTTEMLEEYMNAFRNRTEYLKLKLPQTESIAKHSEISYMISMVDRIKTEKIEDCYSTAELMLTTVKNNQAEFVSSIYHSERDLQLIKKYLE